MNEKNAGNYEWNILGHENAVKFLQNSLNKGIVNHAYIFAGPENLGKSSLARLFTDSLMCGNFGIEGERVPCGKCSSCKQISSGVHPDIYYVNLERNGKTDKLNRNITIEQVKDLQSRLSRSTFLDSYKVAIIFNADYLSESAFNALLKTLEEPSKKTVIILMAHNLDELPRTIVSRCQLVNFTPVGGKVITDHLASKGADKQLANELANMSCGRPGIAINYFNNDSEYSEYKNRVTDFVDIIYQSVDERVKSIDSMIVRTVDYNESIKNSIDILGVWRSVTRDLLLVENSSDNLLTNSFIKEGLRKLSDDLPAGWSVRALQGIERTVMYLKSNANPKLSLENLVINL